MVGNRGGGGRVAAQSRVGPERQGGGADIVAEDRVLRIGFRRQFSTSLVSRILSRSSAKLGRSMRMKAAAM